MRLYGPEGNKRQKKKKKKTCMLPQFMANEESSPEILQDIVIYKLILVGRDTTSSALSWFFWILSSKPDVKQNILKELENIRVRNRKNISDAFTFDKLRDKHYLHEAISEALRLYLPVPVDNKACLKTI
jgi:cytochrome P450